MNQYWIKVIFFIISSLVFLLLFGVPSFKPERTIFECRGIEIPKEVNTIQMESYCGCMRRTTDIVDLNKRSKFCIERMKIHQQYVKDKLF